MLLYIYLNIMRNSKQKILPKKNKSILEQQKIKNRKITITTLGYVGIFIRRIRRNIKKTKHRSNIIREWYTTQKAYKMILEVVVNRIKIPLLNGSQKLNITPKQVQILFPNFQKMINLTNKLLQILRIAKKTQNPNMIMIGKQLSKFVDQYQIYSPYFEMHAKNQLLMDQLLETKHNQMRDIQITLQQYLSKQDPRKACLTLKDCVDQPLYRLFKYLLLIKDYILKIPSHHSDLPYLNQVLMKLHNINLENNKILKNLQQQKVKLKLIGMANKKLSLDKKIVENINDFKFMNDYEITTIYFRGKIYLFDSFFFVTRFVQLRSNSKVKGQKKVPIRSKNILEKQQLYDIFQFHQFSYSSIQPDLKYYKNLVLFIGKKFCIHFMLQDPTSCFQLFKTFHNIVRSERVKSEDKRNQKLSQSKLKNSRLKQQQIFQNFHPQFKFEVVGAEVRPITTIVQDTVYIVRVMMPYYHESQLLNGLKQLQMKRIMSNRLSSNQSLNMQKSINHDNMLEYDFGAQIEELGIKRPNFLSISQKLQLRFHEIQELRGMIIKKFPAQRIPEINPNRKQIAQNSKTMKTRVFEIQKFCIEQFFNFIFRNKSIMMNPIFILAKMKINEDIWDYVTARNQMMINAPQDYMNFGFEHCSVCSKKSNVGSILDFLDVRKYYVMDQNEAFQNSLKQTRKNSKRVTDLMNSGNKSLYSNKAITKKSYCFNALNNLRTKLLAFNPLRINTLQQILLYYHYLNGRLDYCFLKHRSNSFKLKIVKILIPDVQDMIIRIEVDDNTTVGEVIDQIGKVFEMYHAFDYQLVAIFNGKYRILDRDAFLQPLIRSLDIQHQQVKKQQYYRDKSKKASTSILSKILHTTVQLFSTAQTKSQIIFMKVTYLHKSLEIRCLKENRKKRKLEINQFYWKIQKGLIKLTDQQFIELSAYFYCIKQYDRLKDFKYQKMKMKVLEKFVPEDKSHLLLYYDEVKKKIASLIEDQARILLTRSAQIQLNNIRSKVLNRSLGILDTYTYYIEASLKQLPEYIERQSQFNINNSSRVRNSNSTSNLNLSSISSRQVPQKLIKLYNSNQSCLIGINYKQFIVTKSQLQTVPIFRIPILDVQHYITVKSLYIKTMDDISGYYRFDSQMIYHFGELMRKYRVITDRFPQHRP